MSRFAGLAAALAVFGAPWLVLAQSTVATYSFSMSSHSIAPSSASIPSLPSSAPAPSRSSTPPVYTIEDNIVGERFYKAFSFEAIPDPTHGRVNYVNIETAVKNNLTFGQRDTFILRADHTKTLEDGGPGRESVRLQTRKTYGTHVSIFDVRHMPQGCGTWPAIWSTQTIDWPTGGEVDILEGVNDQGPNRPSLHTTDNCMMPTERLMTGRPHHEDCDVAANWNAGCGVHDADPRSYGPEFNKNGGGWYAVERTPQHIKIWFWPRSSPRVPSDVKDYSEKVDPQRWGLPVAYFPNTQCDLEEHFSEHNIIINLTFCGDWGNAVYSDSNCPKTCHEFVADPANFVDAYFDFRAVRFYKQAKRSWWTRVRDWFRNLW